MKSLLFLISLNLFATDKTTAQAFFRDFMGHVHKTPSRDGSSLTAIQCGFKVKVLKSPDGVDTNWTYVKVGEDEGYVESERLVFERPSCFQQKYQDYYNALNLDLTDLYYLGRLDEQMVFKESKAN